MSLTRSRMSSNSPSNLYLYSRVDLRDSLQDVCVDWWSSLNIFRGSLMFRYIPTQGREKKPQRRLWWPSGCPRRVHILKYVLREDVLTLEIDYKVFSPVFPRHSVASFFPANSYWLVSVKYVKQCYSLHNILLNVLTIYSFQGRIHIIYGGMGSGQDRSHRVLISTINIQIVKYYILS